MKIFVIPPKNDVKHLSVFKSGIAYLESLGHIVYFFNPDESLNYTKELQNSDVLIFDSSLEDFNSGFVISKAIALKKIILLLSFSDFKERVNKNIFKDTKGIFTTSYNKENLNKVLDKCLKELSNKLDSKFILIIPSEIDRYLEWASENKRLHKAQIVREALEVAMKKDREYKDSVN